MKLTEILNETQVISDLKSRSKKAVMEELCQSVSLVRPELDTEDLMKVLLERERLGSTGIGDGIAIPHGKMPN